MRRYNRSQNTRKITAPCHAPAAAAIAPINQLATKEGKRVCRLPSPVCLLCRTHTPRPANKRARPKPGKKKETHSNIRSNSCVCLWRSIGRSVGRSVRPLVGRSLRLCIWHLCAVTEHRLDLSIKHRLLGDPANVRDLFFLGRRSSASSARNNPHQNQTKPNQTKPNQTKRSEANRTKTKRSGTK